MTVAGDLLIGTEFLGYRIDELLGRGGMGVVYRAYDLRLKRNVALKLIAPGLSEDERFRERFLTETEIAASLEHPSVVPIYDAGEVKGQLYLAMRYVEGSDLKALLQGEGELAPERAIAICSQVAGAVDAAHARGLVHRDVKPSNVLLDQEEHAYLADFGLSRRLSEQAAGFEPALSLGTPAYVAPEQIEGEDADASADVYSLGCVLYECLTGQAPYPRDSELAVLWAHLNDPPPSPPHLEEVIAKALAKDPKERYGSCGELVAAARDRLGVAAPVRSRWLRAPLLLGLTGLLLIAAALAAYFAIRGGGGAEATGGTDSLVRIDAASGKVEQRLRLGRGVDGVEVGSGSIWVASVNDSAVWRVDPRTGKVQRITGFLEPHEVRVSERDGFAYVGFRDGIGTIDLATGKESGAALKGTIAPAQIDVGPLGVWSTGFILEGSRSGVGFGDTVGKVVSINDFGSPTLPVKIPVEHTPIEGKGFEALADLAVGDTAIWAIGDLLEHAVYRIDPQTRTVTRLALPGPAGNVAAGADGVWVTGVLDDVVWRIDPASGSLVDTIPVGRAPSGISVGGSSVWVTSSIDGTVSRIDAQSGKIVETIDVGGLPRGVAFADGNVWVASRAE